MPKEPHRVADILRSAIACSVTKAEHGGLTALGPEHDGWDRYIAAEIDVWDAQEDKPSIESGQPITRSRVP